ncbi:unnamed protein product [Leuciscus chuanchicus]
MICITGCWDQDDQKGVYSCPQCRQSFTTRPVLGKNTMLAEVVEKLKKTKLQAARPAQCYTESGDVECDVCTGDKNKAIKSCLRKLGEMQRKFQQRMEEKLKELEELREAVESHKRSAQAAVEDSERIFTELICSIERSRSEVTQLIRDQEKTAVSRAEERLERLEQEIEDLRRRDTELEQLSHTDDHIQFLQSFQSLSVPPGSTDSPSITVSPRLSFDDVGKSVSHLREKLEHFCREEIEKISDKVTHIEIIPTPEPKTREEFLQYSHQLTADSNTVNENLALFEGNQNEPAKMWIQRSEIFPQGEEKGSSISLLEYFARCAQRTMEEERTTADGSQRKGKPSPLVPKRRRGKNPSVTVPVVPSPVVPSPVVPVPVVPVPVVPVPVVRGRRRKRKAPSMTCPVAPNPEAIPEVTGIPDASPWYLALPVSPELLALPAPPELLTLPAPPELLALPASPKLLALPAPPQRPVTSADPETVHVTSADPETVHVTSADPETVHVTSADPETVHVTSAEPVSSDRMAAAEPVSLDKMAAAEPDPVSADRMVAAEPVHVTPAEPVSTDKMAAAEPVSSDKMAATEPLVPVPVPEPLVPVPVPEPVVPVPVPEPLVPVPVPEPVVPVPVPEPVVPVPVPEPVVPVPVPEPVVPVPVPDPEPVVSVPLCSSS